jgi:voltage-dependent calcium channel
VVVESNPPIVLMNQLCGGQIDPVTLNATGFFHANGDQASSPKGYICPLGQHCLEQTDNPHNHAEHFDNVLAAALEIVIIASVNGWAPLMYNMMDADFFVSCFFFIICVIVLNFWLINLFVAVITNMFSNIRAETNQSAFGAET